MANAALRAKIRKTYTKVALKFFGAECKIEFLERNQFQDGYNTLRTLNQGWWLEYDNFNRNFVLDAVEEDGDTLFEEEVASKATHVRLTANTEAAPVIYKIDRRTVEPPQGAEVSWRMRCDRVLRSTSNYAGLGR